MKISDTGLKDAFVINPVLHGDERGYFFEGFSRQRLAEAMGYDFDVAGESFAQHETSFAGCIIRWRMFRRN